MKWYNSIIVLKKRHFDDNNSLKTLVKKRKFIQFSMRIMEKSILGLRSAEEQELHSLERDIEQCSKELLKKKKQASGIKRRNQNYKKMKNKIEECAEDLAADKARVGLLEEFNKKNEHGLKKNKKELCKVMDGNNDIDCGGRKEEELETLSQKIVEITEEIKTKKKELGDAKISVSDNVKELVSLRSKLIKVMSKRRTDKCDQMKDFESSKKQYEGRVTEFKSKEEEFKGQVKDLESFKKHLKAS